MVGTEGGLGTASNDTSGRGTDARGVAGPSRRWVKCTYLRGGTCTTHGPGAKLHWRPRPRPSPGPGESKTYKEYYYACDVGPEGGRRLRQTRLSFLDNTRNNNSGQDNTRLRRPDTTSEGHNTTATARGQVE